MVCAKELYDLAMKKNHEIALEVLDGVFEYICNRMKEEADEGSTYYEHRCKQCRGFNREELLKHAIEMVKPLEDKGYTIYIYDIANGYYCTLVIKVSWYKDIPTTNINEKYLYVTNSSTDIKNNTKIENDSEDKFIYCY